MAMAPAVDPRWTRGPADELALAEGCWFDEDAAEHVCAFIETFCCQSKGRWAGRPIELLEWQRDFLSRLFGWKRPDGLRRYTRAYLEVAKKNGKSTLVSALLLYLLIADGEGAPEVYCNAFDRSQAAIVFDEAARMVQASPDLKRRIKLNKSSKTLVDPVGYGTARANSKEVASKDGINPHGVIFDELHRQRDTQLWDIFEYASASRDQPIKISITTAGEDSTGVWHEQRDYSERVNAGTIPDISHLGVVYRALETDDIDDPETWKKANPSMGVTIDPKKFGAELEEAKQLPRKLAGFKRLRLNIIARGAAKFINTEAWLACGRLPVDRDRLRGKACFGGLDLSSTNDLTALALVFGDTSDGLDVLMRYWLPEENIVELEQLHGAPYRAWADAGFIELTTGPVVDYAWIRKEINALAGEYDLKKILLDPCNGTQVGTELREKDGIPLEFIRQGFISLNAPTKELERLINGRKLCHGNHPILTWNAENAVAVKDENDNIKLSKRKSVKKIDGAAALVNAVAAATTQAPEESVYNERGIFFL